jgi:hypothetical protein
MSKKTKETNHFQYKHTFYDQEHILISNFYYSYTTRKLLTSDREKKIIYDNENIRKIVEEVRFRMSYS